MRPLSSLLSISMQIKQHWQPTGLLDNFNFTLVHAPFNKLSLKVSNWINTKQWPFPLYHRDTWWPANNNIFVPINTLRQGLVFMHNTLCVCSQTGWPTCLAILHNLQHKTLIIYSNRKVISKPFYLTHKQLISHILEWIRKCVKPISISERYWDHSLRHCGLLQCTECG